MMNTTIDLNTATLVEWVGELGQENEEVWKSKSKVSGMR